MWFIGEWWNDASSDNFSYIFGFIHDWKVFNFNQLLALFLMAWGAWRIARIIPSPLSDWILRSGEIMIHLGNQVIHRFDLSVKKARKSWKNR